MEIKFKKILGKLWLAGLLLFPLISKAQTSKFIPNDCLVGNAEKCDLVDLVQLFSNLYSLGVKYLGALALLLFVVGGITFMTSGGNQERVKRGKDILIGTSIGLTIVLSSYVIILNIQKLINTESAYQLDSTTSQNKLNCVGETDGTVCSGKYGNVYVCKSNLCQNGENGNGLITTCVYNLKGTCKNNCTGSCPTGTCKSGYCDGSASTQCCVP
jgi:hypothetical protein